MADTDRPDLDAWERIALESERHYGYSVCIECDCGPAPLREVISYARSLESQLAEAQAELLILGRGHEPITDADLDRDEIESLRSQLAETRSAVKTVRYTNEGQRLTEAEISRGAVNPDMQGLLRAQSEAIRLGVGAHHVAAIVRAYLNPPPVEV